MRFPVAVIARSDEAAEGDVTISVRFDGVDEVALPHSLP